MNREHSNILQIQSNFSHNFIFTFFVARENKVTHKKITRYTVYNPVQVTSLHTNSDLNYSHAMCN